MALRNIVTVGDPVLTKVCRPVTKFDDRLSQLIDDMIETLHDANGAGLAAPQITYIMHALKEHGLHVDADATTVEEARDSILAALAQANSPLLNKGGAEK